MLTATVLMSMILLAPKSQTEVVVTTGYCRTYPCVNKGREHGITKRGDRAEPGTCAADWKVFPAGSWFYITGYGLCQVTDTGRLVKGKHLDLFFNTEREARNWGRHTQIVRRAVMVETQDTIGKWATDNFGKPTPLAVLRRSCDELLESMEVCVVQTDETNTIFNTMRFFLGQLSKFELHENDRPGVTSKVAEELADSMIVNYHAAAVLGVQIHDYVDAKMEVNRRRLWKKNPDGTGQHVDEDTVLESIADEPEVGC
jgi:3D (Asp-Asp-Asp) domain-containing protein